MCCRLDGAYQRWLEARTCWGQVVISSRELARQVRRERFQAAVTLARTLCTLHPLLCADCIMSTGVAQCWLHNTEGMQVI